MLQNLQDFQERMGMVFHENFIMFRQTSLNRFFFSIRFQMSSQIKVNTELKADAPYPASAKR